MSLRRELVNIIQGFLFPSLPGCPLCGRPGSPRQLCRACLELWAGLGEGMGICERCGRFGTNFGHSKICRECQAETPYYVLARGVAPYEGPVRDALSLFKFAGKQELALPLGELMAGLVKELFPYRTFAGVVPVPLYAARERERRFNQAALLAGVISRRLQISLAERALYRERETSSQTSLTRANRRASVYGAFKAGEDALRLRGKGVLLVDDVFTTGATVGECCRILRDAGAGPVYVVTLATGITKQTRM